MRKLEYAIDFIKQKNGKEFARLRFKGIFPDLRFKVDSLDGDFSLNNLKERIKTESFDQEDKLTLEITNTETEETQKSVIDFSEKWPDDLHQHPTQSQDGFLEINL